MAKTQFQQEPMAIVGFACRLPGGNNSEHKLWSFLEKGGIAPNAVPPSRFNFSGHWDGSHKPGTMRPAGGMFLSDDIDLARFDAGFFEVSGADATAMDPNQRQMLEVVYEALENAGIPLEQLDGAPVACFVGSYATDYLDMMQRDAEDRAPGFSSARAASSWLTASATSSTSKAPASPSTRPVPVAWWGWTSAAGRSKRARSTWPSSPRATSTLTRTI